MSDINKYLLAPIWENGRSVRGPPQTHQQSTQWKINFTQKIGKLILLKLVIGENENVKEQLQIHLMKINFIQQIEK